MALWFGGLRGGRHRILSSLSFSCGIRPPLSFFQKRNFAERYVQEERELKREGQGIVSTNTMQRGKEAGFSAVFIGFSLFVTGGVLYKFVWEDYLSPDSTYNLCKQSLTFCKKHQEVKFCFGEPVELKGKVKDVSSQESYGNDGKLLRKRIQFFIEGPRESGECSVVFTKNEGKWFKMESFDILSPRGELCLLANKKMNKLY